MPQLPPEPDDFQQDIPQRNQRLAQLLSGLWLGFNVSAIRREPVPSEPPDPHGPRAGWWIAETP